MNRIVITTALLLASAAFADAAKDVKDAKALNEAFAKAGSIADPTESVAAVAALFVEDMKHIGVFGVVNGKAELIKTITPPFHAPNRKVELVSNEGTSLDKDVVMTIAKFKNSFGGPDGKEIMLNLRCVRTMKRQADGKFLIVAEHTSVAVPLPQPPPTK
jgi:ketosteroid isomerase-like protein